LGIGRPKGGKCPYLYLSRGRDLERTSFSLGSEEWQVGPRSGHHCAAMTGSNSRGAGRRVSVGVEGSERLAFGPCAERCTSCTTLRGCAKSRNGRATLPRSEVERQFRLISNRKIATRAQRKGGSVNLCDTWNDRRNLQKQFVVDGFFDPVDEHA